MAVVFVAMTACIWCIQEYRFYNMESNWLFLYDWSDIWAKLTRVGGLSLLVASFMMQFMRLALVGPVLAAAVYMLSTYMLYKVFSRKCSGPATSGLALMPAAFLFLCLENDYYEFYGHVAFLLTVTALWVYTSIKKDRTRFVVGLIMVLVLYFIAGSVTVVFSVTACVIELTERRLKGLPALSYLLMNFLAAYVCLRTGWTSSWETSLTPFMYYSRPSTYFFPIYAWTLVPLLYLVSWILSGLRWKLKWGVIFAVAGLVFAFFLAGNFYGKVHSRSSYRLIQEQYLADNGDWEEIIKTADRRQPTFLVSYLNLALAQKDMLVKNFAYYNPQDLSVVMLPTPNLKSGLSMQSNIYMSWGYVASARKAAFDGNLVTPGSMHPRLLQILVQSNLVLGADEVAEKYIMLLEKTLFYRGWATSMRQFLNNPDAVRNDPYLGDLCASLPLKDEYARYDGLSGDMRDILEANPSQRILAQFYELYKILEMEGNR